MKTSIEKNGRRTGFTIVELLTVMSIIVILISLLVPSLNKVKRYAKKVKQKAQFHSVDVAMELYATEFDGYPNSDAIDGTTATGVAYNGALKLAEAMMGQDLLGFHPDSHFRSDGTTGSTPATQLYPKEADVTMPAEYAANLKARRGPYLQLDNANAFKLKHLYGVGNTAPLEGEKFVLCDVYARVRVKDDPGDDTDNNVKGKIGMPILYFRANLSATKHDVAVVTTAPTTNIYNALDNTDLVQLGMPWQTGVDHPLYKDPLGGVDWERFYIDTKNDKIATTDKPYNSDSYILISAGFDGEYGTSDDVFNFGD